MRTLIEFLTDYNKKEGYGTESEDLDEALAEMSAVWTGGRDEHRWYVVVDKVVKVNIEGEDRFFQTFYYETTGDGNADDYGLDRPTAEGASEVYPHTVSTTVYKNEPQGYEI